MLSDAMRLIEDKSSESAHSGNVVSINRDERDSLGKRWECLWILLHTMSDGGHTEITDNRHRFIGSLRDGRAWTIDLDVSGES